MAIVIKETEKGNIYKSIYKTLISDNEIVQADNLNQLIKKQIVDFIYQTSSEELTKNRFENYWKLGNMLREIFFNSGLAEPNEKELFFINVRLHMDKHTGFFPKDDKKRRRNIPSQLFKLAGYPYNIANKMEWSQWSYLFDNIYLMESTNFDTWFKKILESNKYLFNESFTRLWAESFNLLFKKIDLTDWTEEEFIKPLICTLEIINNLIKAGLNIESRLIRKSVKNTIMTTLSKHRREFILMQMDKLSTNEYIDLLTKSILADC